LENHGGLRAAGAEGESREGLGSYGGGGGGGGGDGDGMSGWVVGWSVGWSVRSWMHRGGAIGSEARGTQPHRQNPTSPINT